MSTTFYLIRHAESLGNENFEKGIYLENTPLGSNLSELGKAQAKNLAKTLESVHFDAVYTSPLNRAHETARAIALGKEIAILEDLRERIKGNLGGESEEEVRKIHPFLFGDTDNLTDEEILNWKLFADMESAQEAADRLSSTLLKLADQHQKQTILVVTHGNILRSFLVSIGHKTFKELGAGSIGNCGCIILRNVGGTFQHLKTVKGF